MQRRERGNLPACQPNPSLIECVGMTLVMAAAVALAFGWLDWAILWLQGGA